MTATATGIPLRHLHLVWSDLWPLLEPAVKRSPDFSASHRAGPGACPEPADWVLARLIFNDAQLWAVYDASVPVAAIVTQIQVVGPSTARHATVPATDGAGEKRCLIWLVGGSRLGEWAADFIAKLEDWARALGCGALRGVGRPGWARIVKKFGGVSVDAVDGLPAWERRIA